MLGVMLQKLWHKKWMVFCLLIGSILLIATVVSFPMYRSAAFDRMLRDEFTAELTGSGEWPGRLHFSVTAEKEKGVDVIESMERRVAELYHTFGVTEKDTVRLYGTVKMKAASLMNREDLKDVYLCLSMLADLPKHADLVAGEMYSQDGLTEDGCVEVVIARECMVKQGLLLGETLEFARLTHPDGTPIRMKVVGVFEENADKDFFWQLNPGDKINSCFMNEQLFREIFTGEHQALYTINGDYYMLFEYMDMKATGVEQLYEETVSLVENTNKKNLSAVEYLSVLDRFEAKKSRIEATLFILQVPVLILLCAFLFMISGQMYDMERNEISVLKSRGSSGGQIFRLYLYQSVFLTLAGILLGVPVGTLFCRMLGSAQNFLEFDVRRKLEIAYGADVILYTLGAALVSVLIMTVPAVKHSRLSIVHLKQAKAAKKRSWWERCFLDVICLAVGLYGFYNFSMNESILVENVLRGESLDPLLYFSSSIFVVGAGLLLLRIHPLLIKGIYLLGKKFWGPASYASFMENMHNGRKQQFIMLFLMLTISLGMYHATVARTILQNALDNRAYLDGADVIIKEVWATNNYYETEDGADASQYIEPDYFKYSMLDSVNGYTKVLCDRKGYIGQKSNNRLPLTVLGIHTKEFGENTYIDRDLLEKHYYEYLNALAVEPKGILVSRNLQTIQGYKIGDTLDYRDSGGIRYRGTIVGFVDYWPSYEPKVTSVGEDGTVTVTEQYLVVAHYASLLQQGSSVRYEVWMSMKEDADNEELYQWLQDNEVPLAKYVNRLDNREAVLEDPLLQGTNGVLTMGFIVTMILCAVGYMIYWIMSIRSREMMFGVLRASGMHKGELLHMLLNEQIFSGVFSVAAGIGIGKLTSDMYVPMIQAAYAASNQVLPLELITNNGDMLRLYGVIAGTMLLCLIVLIVIVFKLNVAKALKLGED